MESSRSQSDFPDYNPAAAAASKDGIAGRGRDETWLRSAEPDQVRLGIN
jgi:hypothetical protein